ncbi:Methyltransferase [Pleurostoma richardsiae]|uniref:Methyltransferase n=1 Tax=Pleurostoma richardsiae TaxID=41990 RepID=A0AA38RG67_9PEZI|nr:Methyltransferase [Pleurostoma richardsiae]
MARNKNKSRRGGGRGGQGGGRGGGWRSDDRGGHASVRKENEKLQRYYDTILALPEEEKTKFWEALRRELPNSFRFAGSKGHALTVRKLLETRYIPEITKIHHDGQPVDPPLPVSWYPDNLAWWMTTPKNVVRRFPPFAAFQKFLVSETSVGNISRQEVVSMIPPLLMDLRPGMVVLDLCAAPGSKAAQLLEMIHQGEEGRMRKALQLHAKEDGREVSPAPGDEDVDMSTDPGDDGRATGLLIANDFDYKRSHMLIHQLKRLSSPNMIVTNCDATMYPSLRLPSDDGKTAKFLKFDRILADVPCSGDGTLRKNVNLWKDWLPGSALGLHLTQVRILVRALQMLKVGGRVVYSTCSMNPVENESVVVRAIERCGGLENVELLDCSDQLPLLKRAPGLKSWKVMDKQGRVWDSWKQVEDWTKETKDQVTPGRLVESMFSKEDTDVPLERCMRVYSHMQDTGGFFITVLEKKAEFKAKPDDWKPSSGEATISSATSETANGTEEAGDAKVEAVEAQKEDETPIPTEEVKKEEPKEQTDEVKPELTGAKREREDDVVEEIPSKKLNTGEKKADADVEAKVDSEGKEADTKPGVQENNGEKKADAKAELQDGYGVRKRADPYEEPFKYLPTDHEAIKNIRDFYKISPRFPSDRFMVRNATGEPAKAIYYTSALVRDLLVNNEGKGVRFIHGGVKMFVKQDSPSAEVCRWRIQSEGMPILAGYIGPERVVYLHKKETLRKLLIEMFPKIANGEWANLDEIGERVRDLGMGCCVLKVEPDPASDPEFTEKMSLPLWKSFASLNLMLPKEDRAAMLLRIFNDTTPLVNNVQKDREQAQAKANEAAAAEEGKEAAEEAKEGDVEMAEAAAAEDEQLQAVYDAEDAPSP